MIVPEGARSRLGGRTGSDPDWDYRVISATLTQIYPHCFTSRVDFSVKLSPVSRLLVHGVVWVLVYIYYTHISFLLVMNFDRAKTSFFFVEDNSTKQLYVEDGRVCVCVCV